MWCLTAMNSKLTFQGCRRSPKKSDGSCSSGRESGECTPSPIQELDNVDDTDDVIFVKRIVRTKDFSKHGTQDQLKVSVVSTNDDDLANISSDSVQVIDDKNDRIFVLDTTGAIEDIEEIHASGAFFDNDVKDSLDRTSEKKKEKLNMSMVLTFAGTAEPLSHPKQESLRKTTCFNCGGSHMLDQCDIPRDMRRIAKNRSAHFNNKRQSARYISDTDVSTFKPGEISEDLREALGIGVNDIPEWIYRMRRKGFIDGYPPAYLKQAIEDDSSNLLEFHMEDSSFDNSNSPDLSTKSVPRINRDKMFQYPGFNVYRSKLNDRERHSFRIPSFSAFVNYHQCALKDRMREERKAKQKSPSKRRCQENIGAISKKTKSERKAPDESGTKLSGDNQDYGHGSSTATFHMNSSKQVKVNEMCEISLATPPTVPRTHSSPAVLGMSSSKCSGTPHGNSIPASNSKPDLEKFREGILPFEAREDTNLQRGFFQRLMKVIKKDALEN